MSHVRFYRAGQLNVIPAVLMLAVIMGAIYYLPQTVLERLLDTRELEAKILAERVQQQVWKRDPVIGIVLVGRVERDQPNEKVQDRVERAVLTGESDMPLAVRIDIEEKGSFFMDEERYRDLKPLAGISKYQTFNVHQAAYLTGEQGDTRTRVHTEIITTAKRRVR